jgi:hypothetical protein
MQAPYEGAFASSVLGRNLEPLAPFASVLAGVGAWQAGPGGLLQGRFGWGNPATGLVSNSPTTPADSLGLVIPLQSVNYANGGVVGGPAKFGGPQAAWTWQTYDPQFKAWRMRQGIVATLMDTGNFWLRFAGGANYGDTVYASTVDGSAISGNPGANAVMTAFKVVGGNRCGSCLVQVSSTAKFF